MRSASTQRDDVFERFILFERLSAVDAIVCDGEQSSHHCGRKRAVPRHCGHLAFSLFSIPAPSDLLVAETLVGVIASAIARRTSLNAFCIAASVEERPQEREQLAP
jgi:hypothetical protein